MDNIQQLRKKIDEVDERILQALSERVEICKTVGLAKKKQGFSIKDADREKQVYEQVRGKAAKLALDPDKIEAVYREIVNICSAVQE